MWEKVCDAFEAANEGVTVELTIDKNLEDVIDPAMKASDYPDVIMRAVGAESGMTEMVLCQEKVQIKCNQFSLF